MGSATGDLVLTPEDQLCLQSATARSPLIVPRGEMSNDHWLIARPLSHIKSTISEQGSHLVNKLFCL